MIFIIYIILISSVLVNSSNLFLNPSTIYINGEYHPVVGLNEECVLDNVKFTLPRERGIGLSNCESGLTCFNFHCVFPSKEGQDCIIDYFKLEKQGSVGFDKSNCTNEFYCGQNGKCIKTKKRSESCQFKEECISVEFPNSTCENKRCVQEYMSTQPEGHRYFFVFFFLSILIYIYYRQYTIQEAQLIRLNELTAQGVFDERRDAELETLPPYSPPSSTFLAEAENDDDSQCNRSHSLISPPSYHQFPPVNVNTPVTIINTSTLNDNNSASVTTGNGNTTINTNTSNTITNSLYPTVNNSNDPNITQDLNRLSVNPRLSFISTQSSLTPNTPPPSYSQPTTPYLYDTTTENANLLPPVVRSPNSSVIQPPIAHSRSISRNLTIGNTSTVNENRYSAQSNPEESSFIDYNNNLSHRYSSVSLRRRSSLRHTLSLGHVYSNANSSSENSPN